MKNFSLILFIGCFLTGVFAYADNTELQDHVLNMAQLTHDEINELLDNHEKNKNELLSTLTKNLIDFINEKDSKSYENPAQLAAIQVAHQNVFLNATYNAAYNAAKNADHYIAFYGAHYIAYYAARNAAWNAARNAARNAAWNAAWNAARNAAWNTAWNAAQNALKKLNLTDSEKIGQTAWLLSELYVLALIGQPQSAFINTYFVDAYIAAYNVLEKDDNFKAQFETTDKVLDYIAGQTWNKPSEENKESLANNPFIQSLMFILDPESRFTAQIVENLANKGLLKIDMSRKKLIKNAYKVW